MPFLGKYRTPPFNILQFKICLHLTFNFNEHNSVISVQNSSIYCFPKVARRSIVAKALCYKLEGRGFETQ
jgi:hypothetical protein